MRLLIKVVGSKVSRFRSTRCLPYRGECIDKHLNNGRHSREDIEYALKKEHCFHGQRFWLVYDNEQRLALSFTDPFGEEPPIPNVRSVGTSYRPLDGTQEGKEPSHTCHPPSPERLHGLHTWPIPCNSSISTCDTGPSTLSNDPHQEHHSLPLDPFYVLPEMLPNAFPEHVPFQSEYAFAPFPTTSPELVPYGLRPTVTGRPLEPFARSFAAPPTLQLHLQQFAPPSSLGNNQSAHVQCCPPLPTAPKSVHITGDSLGPYGHAAPPMDAGTKLSAGLSMSESGSFELLGRTSPRVDCALPYQTNAQDWIWDDYGPFLIS